jgi:hypothetical protein
MATLATSNSPETRVDPPTRTFLSLMIRPSTRTLWGDYSQSSDERMLSNGTHSCTEPRAIPKK